MAKITKLTEEKGRVGGRLTARIKRKNKNRFEKEIVLKGGESVKRNIKRAERI